MEKIKYMTRRHLTRLKKTPAISRVLSQIDGDTMMPITRSLAHNDNAVRVFAIFNEDGEKLVLDLPFEKFAALPEAEI